MRSRPRRLRSLSVAVLALAATLAACSDEPPVEVARAEPDASPPAAFEASADLAPMPGTERCADCHEALVKEWSRTAMARALGPIEPDQLEGLQPVHEKESGLSYHFDSSPSAPTGSLPDAPSLVETFAGNPNYSKRVPLAFAIGAGVQDRAFAAAVGAYLWFAPLEVVTHDGEREAVLAPVHSQQPGTRFTIPITSECLGCHTDALPPERFPQNLYHAPSEWQPRGISCAACHGDVDRHADWQESLERPTAPDPMLALGSLDRTERVSVCAACHLQGDVRIVLGGAHQGPPPPGGDLLDQRALFVAATPTDEIGFVSHVERLVLSRCYTEAVELDCTTCHSPHRDFRTPKERERVRASCTHCHASSSEMPSEMANQTSSAVPSEMPSDSNSALMCSESSEADAHPRDCVDCHMRRTEVFDVREVEVHDHFIQRRPGAPSHYETTRSLEARDGSWKRFAWPDAPAPEHFADPGLWLMANYSRGFLGAARALLDVPLGSAASALPMVHHARGALLESMGELEDAAAAYGRALALDPSTGPSAVNLGAVLAQLGRPTEALAVLDMHLEEHPRSQNGLLNRSIVRELLGDPSGSIADLSQALELFPTPERARTLAGLLTESGETAAAEAMLQRARRLENGDE